MTTKINLNITLTDQERKFLFEMAEANKTTINELVENAIVLLIAEHEADTETNHVD